MKQMTDKSPGCYAPALQEAAKRDSFYLYLPMMNSLAPERKKLFRFVVGMELDVSQLKHQARTAVLVSQVSILFPYLLGVLASLFLFSTLAGPSTSFAGFALFIGISMSITAFPVLARILEERGLTKTPLGSTAIVCAATDDVTAWTLLALVVAIAKARGVASALLSLGLVMLVVVLMLFWLKPRLPRWIGRAAHDGGSPGKGVTASVLIFLFASAPGSGHHLHDRPAPHPRRLLPREESARCNPDLNCTIAAGSRR